MTPMLHETILDLEDQTWKALQSSGHALLPFLSSDCIMLFPLGIKVSTRTQPNLKDVMCSEAFVPWKSYKMSDVEVTSLGPDAAVISYKTMAIRAVIDREDVNEPFQALISSTWRRDPEAGRWLLCFHQQTPYQNIPV